MEEDRTRKGEHYATAAVALVTQTNKYEYGERGEDGGGDNGRARDARSDCTREKHQCSSFKARRLSR